ncbi:MAG: cytochrome c biogenesis protein CcsA [Planctomycetota bacterium]
MTQAVTNTALVALTLAAVAASVIAFGRLRAILQQTALAGVDEDGVAASGGACGGEPGKKVMNLLVGGVAAGSLALLMFRWSRVGGGWNPLVAHVDGLLLIASLLAGVGLYVQSRPRLGGLAAFSLPLLTLILAWAVCASAWTYRPFAMDTLHPVWRAVHLSGVYLGTLGCSVAAAAGVMYLVVARRLKAKRNPRGLMRLASLEALERVIVQTATLGFALLTVGLVSGVVILAEEGGGVIPGGWASPKVVLAFVAWLTYALVMNVRVAAVFRGRRAAWLAIGGWVLLLVVYGIVTSGPSPEVAPEVAPEAKATEVLRQDAKAPGQYFHGDVAVSPGLGPGAVWDDPRQSRGLTGRFDHGFLLCAFAALREDGLGEGGAG